MRAGGPDAIRRIWLRLPTARIRLRRTRPTQCSNRRPHGRQDTGTSPIAVCCNPCVRARRSGRVAGFQTHIRPQPDEANGHFSKRRDEASPSVGSIRRHFDVQWPLPGDEIVPSSVNSPTPLFGPVNCADPVSAPCPVEPVNRPVPPTTV